MTRSVESEIDRATKPRSSVRLDLIEAVSPSLLCEVLKPHSAFLASRGADLSAHPADALLVRLYETLNADDPEIPAALRRTLVHLTAMSSELGFEALVDAAVEHGELHFAGRAATLSRQELAVETYLKLPDIFATARGRVRAHSPQRYIEYFPRTPVAMDARQLRAALPKFEAALRQHFASRTGSDYCRILPSLGRHDHDLLVCHAGPPGASRFIRRDGQPEVSQGWTEVRDVVLIDRHTGRLALCAQSPADQDCYREIAGEAFFGDASHYALSAVYTGAPLLECGAASLRTDDVEGLQRVEIAEVRLRHRNAATQRAWIHPSWALFASAEWQRAKGHSDVTYVRFAFHLSDNPYSIEVELLPPNTIVFDRRFVAHHAYSFLPRRGFMLHPTHRSSVTGT